MAFQVEEGRLPSCFWDNSELGMNDDGADFISKGGVRGVPAMGTLERPGIFPALLAWRPAQGSLSPGSGLCREALWKKEGREDPAPSGLDSAHSCDRNSLFYPPSFLAGGYCHGPILQTQKLRHHMVK